MKKWLHTFVSNSQGFTLIEILIVIAVIVILTAIIAANVSGLGSNGKPEAAKAELATVQSAMDGMMAKSGLSTVTAVTTATKDMTIFPTGHPLFPDYFFSSQTKGTYTCSSDGAVTQVTTGY